MTWIDRLAARFGYEAKSDPTAPLVVKMLGGGPVYNDANYAAAAKYGYNSNVYVHRGVRLLSEALAGIPWKVRRTGSHGHGAAIEDHPLALLLNHPNDDMGGGFFREWFTSYLLLSGNAFVTVTRRKDTTPLELWLLRPDRVKIQPGADTRVGEYLFDVGSGKPQRFVKEDVLHSKFFNPLDEWYGMSPIAVASRVIDQHNAANDANTALLQNFMRSPGALVAKGLLTPEDLDGLKEEVRQKWQGPKNSGKPLVLHGDLSWQPMGNTPIEMDWRQGKEAAAIEILIALGIPPELCGIAAQKTYSNVQQARVGLIEDTALPLLDRIIDQYNTWLPPAYTKARPGEQGRAGVEIYYDRDDIEVLAEDALSKRTFVMDAFSKGVLTVNEAREGAGYPALTGDDAKLGDKRYMASSMGEVLSVEEKAKQAKLLAPPPLAPFAKPGGGPADGGKPPTGAKPASTPEVSKSGAKPQTGPAATKSETRDMVDALLQHPDVLARVTVDDMLTELGTGIPPKLSPYDALEKRLQEERKYSPSQARDGHGRWASFGAGGFLDSPGNMSFYSEADRLKITATLAAAGVTSASMEARAQQYLDDAKKSGVYESARDWYDKAHDASNTVAEHFGVKPDVVYGMVAALSPQNAWSRDALTEKLPYRYPNSRDALVILHLQRENPALTVNQSILDATKKYFPKSSFDSLLDSKLTVRDLPPEVLASLLKARGGLIDKAMGGTSSRHGTLEQSGSASALPTSLVKAISIARGGDIEANASGSKVASFYNNIKSPRTVGPVTIDSLMAQAMTGKKANDAVALLNTGGVGHPRDTGRSEKANTYPAFADAIVRVALRNNLNPAQCQAIVWSQYRTVK